MMKFFGNPDGVNPHLIIKVVVIEAMILPIDQDLLWVRSDWFLHLDSNLEECGCESTDKTLPA